MKKIFGLAFIFLLGISAPSFAQSTASKAGTDVKKGVKKAGHGIKKGANKTAQVASKGKANVTDKKSDTWIGPNGQTIYVDDGSKYYWINGNGKKIYVSQAALRARQK
jgi:hypothetical protein